MTGVKRLYRQMVKEPQDFNHSLECERVMTLLLDATHTRAEIERDRSSQGTKKQTTKQRKRIPQKKDQLSPKLKTAADVYKTKR